MILKALSLALLLLLLACASDPPPRPVSEGHSPPLVALPCETVKAPGM